MCATEDIPACHYTLHAQTHRRVSNSSGECEREETRKRGDGSSTRAAGHQVGTLPSWCEMYPAFFSFAGKISIRRSTPPPACHTSRFCSFTRWGSRPLKMLDLVGEQYL